jgi:hypothetical protein
MNFSFDERPSDSPWVNLPGCMALRGNFLTMTMRTRLSN